MVATLRAIAGDHMRIGSPARTNKYGNIQKTIEHTTDLCSVIACNLLIRTDSNKDNLGTAGVVPVYQFIINMLHATRTAGQPISKKL